MGDEPESRGANRGRPCYNHIFPLEAVVPVEWYSRAQLEYLAEKIRRSQSIDSLLLPIPRTIMFGNRSQQFTVIVDQGGGKPPRSISSQRTTSKSSMENFSNEDLSRPLRIASPPSQSGGFSDSAEEEEDAVVQCLESIINLVVKSPNRQLRGSPPTNPALGRTPRKLDYVTSEEVEHTALPKIEETVSYDERLSRFCQLSAKKPESTASLSSEKTDVYATQKPEHSNHHTRVKQCDQRSGGQRPQRFHRRKEPLAARQSEGDMVLRLHEPDIQGEVSPSLQQRISQKLNELVLVVPSAGDSNPLLSRANNASACGDNLEPERPGSARIEEIVSRVNIAPRKPPAHMPLECEDSRHYIAAECREELPVFEEPHEEGMEINRELLDLFLDKNSDDLSCEEMMEGAIATILLEESNEVELINKKVHLTALKRELTGKLAKLQNHISSTQRLERPVAHLRRSLPKKRGFAGTHCAPPAIHTHVAGPASRNVKPLNEAATAQRMTLPPGTLLRVVQGRVSNDPGHTQRIAVIPAGLRSGKNPDVRLFPTVESSRHNPSAPLNAQTNARMGTHSRRTIDLSFLPSFTADPNLEHNRTGTNNMRALAHHVPVPANLVPTTIPLSSNPNTNSSTNYTRVIQVGSTSLSPVSGILSGSNATLTQVGSPRPIGDPGHGGNDRESSPVNSQAQTRQLIQVPSYAFPVKESGLVTKVPNSRVVMVTPAQFSALQSQAQQRRPIRIHQVRECAPPAAIHQPGVSDDLAAVRATTTTGLKPQIVYPVTFTERRTPNFQPSDPSVIFSPSLNIQMVRPCPTIAPRYFTVAQPHLARPPGPPQ